MKQNSTLTHEKAKPTQQQVPVEPEAGKEKAKQQGLFVQSLQVLTHERILTLLIYTHPEPREKWDWWSELQSELLTRLIQSRWPYQLTWRTGLPLQAKQWWGSGQLKTAPRAAVRQTLIWSVISQAAPEPGGLWTCWPPGDKLLAKGLDRFWIWQRLL